MQTLQPLEEQVRKLHTSAVTGSQRQNQHMVPIGELLTPKFVRRHSRFPNVEVLLSESGLNPCVLADLDLNMRRRLDDFTRLTTSFPDWAAMLQEARGQWVMRRMGIGIDA